MGGTTPGGGEPAPESKPPPAQVPDTTPEGDSGPPEGGISVFGSAWNYGGPPEGYYRTVASEGDEGNWLVAAVEGADTMQSQQFELARGLAILTFDFTGMGECSVLIKDTAGTLEQRLLLGVDQLGARAFHIDQPGQYFFDVIASGNWIVNVWQPTPSTTPHIDRFDGQYSSVTVFSYFEVDQYAFHLTHDGAGDFVVNMLDWEGNPVRQLVNTTGYYDDYPAEFTIQNANVYLFDIVADGNWTIAIE